MAKLVRLRYDFEFDPSEAFTRRSEFDGFLSKFLDAHGFESEIIDFIGSGSEVLYRITKKKDISAPKHNKKQLKSRPLVDQLKRVQKQMPKPKPKFLK